MAGQEGDTASSQELSFATFSSFSKVLSWGHGSQNVSRANTYEDDVFASAPSLKLRKEVVDCSAIGEDSLARYDMEKNEAQSNPYQKSQEIQWDLPASLLMPENFCMHTIRRPTIKLTPYGEKRTRDAFALTANSMRCEVSALLHLVWTILPNIRYVDQAFMRDCLFPWIEDSIDFMTTFAESLFGVVLPAYAKQCQRLSSITARKLTLEKGRFMLCLKAVSESRKAFSPTIPVDEKFRKLVFSCTTLEKSMQYIDSVGMELWKETGLDARGARPYMRKLEAAAWKSLLGTKEPGLEKQRAVMRGMVSRWMNSKELQAFAKSRARAHPRVRFIHTRKLSKAQVLLTKEHECLQCNIGDILESLKNSTTGEHAPTRTPRTPLPQGAAAAEDTVRWAPPAVSTLVVAEDAAQEDDAEASMHNLYDHSQPAHNFTLDDVPSAPSLSALLSAGRLSGKVGSR